MAEFKLADFIRTALKGHVAPLTFVGVEPGESDNSYTITLRLDVERLAHLSPGLRAMLEPQCKEPVIVFAIWDEDSGRITLLIRTIRIPKTLENYTKALRMANEHNKMIGHLSRLSILDEGDHMDAGIVAVQYLPTNEAVAAETLRQVVTQLAMEAGNVATMLIANLQQSSAPSH